VKYAWVETSKKLQAIAQAGLAYTNGVFDRERYQMIQDIANKIISDFTDTDMEKVKGFFSHEIGYPTPKVEIRASVFCGDKVLMVREKADGKWSLPGGWADVELSPFEVAKKEIFEEAGIIVEPKRIIAVIDKTKYSFSLSPFHVYQIFIQCEYIKGELKPGMETLDAKYFERDNYPELSTDRTVKETLDLVFEFFDNPQKNTICD
jgi:ADP-ribose pyrophosphatase YjhB (NUDIX family)